MPPSAAPSRLPLAALTAIVLLGAAMRCWQARESLWLDELHTAWCATGPLAEVAPRATIGNQSPLFFWLSWFVVQPFGPGELTVRLPSLVAGSLLPIALYGLIRHWTREPWLGVLAAWLTVVDPVQIFYATEARPYALVQLLAVVHIGLLAELLHSPPQSSPPLGGKFRDPVAGYGLHCAFVLIAALLFHLHYTAALLFPAEIAAVVLIATSRARGQLASQDAALAPVAWTTLLCDGLVVAVLCLPATPNVLAIFERRTNWELFVPQPTLGSIVTLLPWSWTAAIVLVGQASRLFRRPIEPTEVCPSILALSWLIVPLALAWLLTATDVARLFFLRYLMVSAPAAIVLATLAVPLIPWRTAQIPAGLAVALAALWTAVIPQFATDGRLIDRGHGDWRSAVAHFNRQPDHDRYPVLVTTQLIEADALRGSPDPALAAYCLFPVHSLYPIDADPAITIPLPRTSPGELDSQVRDLVRSRSGAWLIVGGSAAAVDGITQAMQASLSAVRAHESEWQAVQRHSFGTVHVLRFEPLDRGP